MSIENGVIIFDRLELPDGAMSLNDLKAVLKLLKQDNPKEIFEIGTFFGTTTLHLWMNAASDAIIHTLDLPPGDGSATGLQKSDGHLIALRDVGKAFRDVPGTDNIIQHLGDSATWDYSPVKNATFCVIDGSHTYEYVRNDTLACLSHCSRPLTLVWHDYDESHPEVIEFLNDFQPRSGPRVTHMPGTNVAFLRMP